MSIRNVVSTCILFRSPLVRKELGLAPPGGRVGGRVGGAAAGGADGLHATQPTPRRQNKNYQTQISPPQIFTHWTWHISAMAIHLVPMASPAIFCVCFPRGKHFRGQSISVETWPLQPSSATRAQGARSLERAVEQPRRLAVDVSADLAPRNPVHRPRPPGWGSG